MSSVCDTIGLVSSQEFWIGEKVLEVLRTSGVERWYCQGRSWELHAVFPPTNQAGGDSKRENLCQLLKEVTKRRIKDHEDFKRMAINKRLPSPQDLIQSVQRQVKILIDRKDEYKVEILQDWNAFRCSRIYVAGRSGEISRVLRIHIVCWRLKSWSIQLLGNQVGECRNEHGFVEKLNLAARALCSELLERAESRVFRSKDHIHAYVQRHWMDKERQNGKVCIMRRK